MANPSASQTVKIPKLAVIAGGVALATSVGFVAYYAYKKFHSNQTKNESKEFLALAERKKIDGNDLFRSKNYSGAIKLFKEAIDILKSIEGEEKQNANNILSNCYNNISASCEILGDFEDCIRYCSDAIEINPKYYKVLNRRARLYEKLGRYKETLDDYFSMTLLFTNEEQINNLNSNVERVLNSAVVPEANDIITKFKDTYKLIPQSLIVHWLWSSVTNDPILKRLEKLNNAESVAENSLDAVLLLIKKNKYNEVLSLALKIVTITEAEKNSEIKEKNECERQAFQNGAAILLVSRFYYFHNQTSKAREYVKKFEVLKKEWSAEILSNLNDLLVAHLTLLVMFAATDLEAAENVEKSLAIAPKNADPLIVYAMRFFDDNDHDGALTAFNRVLEVELKHPYAEYYILYLNNIIAFKQKLIDQVRFFHYKFDDALKKDSNPPVFALLLFCKVCTNSESLEIAMETAKNVLKIMPNNVHALFLCGVLDCNASQNLEDRENVKNYISNVEKLMHKAIKIDPNYWEPYRTLAKISLDKMNFDETKALYEKAIPLVRTREELQILLKDKILTDMISKRIKDGHKNPFNVSRPTPPV